MIYPLIAACIAVYVLSVAIAYMVGHMHGFREAKKEMNK